MLNTTWSTPTTWCLRLKHHRRPRAISSNLGGPSGPLYSLAHRQIYSSHLTIYAMIGRILMDSSVLVQLWVMDSSYPCCQDNSSPPRQTYSLNIPLISSYMRVTLLSRAISNILVGLSAPLIHVSKLVLYTITYTATRHPFSAQRQTHSIIYSTIHRTPSTMTYDYQQMINLFQVLSIIPVWWWTKLNLHPAFCGNPPSCHLWCPSQPYLVCESDNLAEVPMIFLRRRPCPNRYVEIFILSQEAISPHLVVGWPFDEFEPIVVLQSYLVWHVLFVLI